MSSLIRRSFKIACRLFGWAVLAYAVFFSVTIGGIYSPSGRFISGVGDLVEAIIFFPQRFLPPTSQISSPVHWLVCAVWMFALCYVLSLVYAALTSKIHSDAKKNA
jgi:hypothetical protein